MPEKSLDRVLAMIMGAAILTSTASAYAFTTAESQNGTPTYIAATSISDADFSGLINLVATVPGLGSITTSCNMDLVFDINVIGGQAFIEITSGSLSGAGPCSFMALGGFPWQASDIPGGAYGWSDTPSPPTDPVTGAINDIEILIAGAPVCHGSTPVIFNNGAPITTPSSFDFNSFISGNGDCFIDGTLLTPIYGDVNIY